MPNVNDQTIPYPTSGRQVVPIIDGAVTIPASTDDAAVVTLTRNVTVILRNPPVGWRKLDVIFLQDAAGGRTVTWATSVQWLSGAPVIATTANARTRVQLLWDNGVWYEDAAAASGGSMTGAQILAALALVDGTGSGLDADTVDGQHVTAFERKSVIDARDYGVLGDGTTDDTTAIQNAINATPLGGTCVFPLTTAGGAMRISAPVNLLEQRTYLFPLVGRMWTYQYTSPIAGSVKLTSGFSGAAAFLIRGKEITGRSLENDGIHVAGLVVDCGAASGNMHGLQVEGLCRDLSFVDCAMQNAQGTGNGWDFRTGTGSAAPRGIRMERCAAVYADANGFRFNGVTDSYFADLLAVGNTMRGIYASNSGENSFMACRAVFNTTDGFFFDGTTSVGLTTLVAPATDRNGQNGILISQSGTQPIQIVAPRLRRDGSSSTSSNYSGLRLTGSAGLEVVPVDVVIPQVSVGVDDGGGGSQTPQHAVRALRAQRLTIHGGDLWGVSGSFSDGGNNTEVSWSKDTAWYTGAIGAKTAATPATVGAKALPLTGGGTGATTAPAARTNLGLTIGTDVEPVSSVADEFGGYSNGIPATLRKGGAWVMLGADTGGVNPANRPTVVSGGLTMTPATGAGYANVNLAAAVTRIGGRWTFGPSSTDNGAAGLIAFAGNISSTYPTIPDSPCHLSITTHFAIFGTFSGNVFDQVAVWEFDPPLLDDDTTVYTCEIHIDQAMSTATVFLPDNSVRVVTDPLIGSITPTWACWEMYKLASTDTDVSFSKVWADSRSDPGLAVANWAATVPLPTAAITYAPAVNADAVATTSFMTADIDSTNLKVTVTSSRTGKVLVTLSGFLAMSGAGVVLWAVGDGGTYWGTTTIATQQTTGRVTSQLLIEGILPETVYEFAWRHYCSVAATATLKLDGPSGYPATMSAVPID